MPERRDIRARLLDGLDPGERAEVGLVAALLAEAPPTLEPPADLEARTLAAIRGDDAGVPSANGAGSQEAPRPARPERRRPRLRAQLRGGRPALAGALLLALVAGVLAGVLADRGPGLPGTPELEATLRAPGRDGASATAVVHNTGIGRVIEFRTDELPILPEGEYYELWFVGPGDRPGSPDRISAGTFHPDERGRSQARFTAAVDPSKYPGLAVTAEPGNGDPAPAPTDVLRSAQP